MTASPIRHDATFDQPSRPALVRPGAARRQWPDLTGILAASLAVLLGLFLLTVAGTHIHARAAETVAQGFAERAM